MLQLYSATIAVQDGYSDGTVTVTHTLGTVAKQGTLRLGQKVLNFTESHVVTYVLGLMWLLLL